MPLCPTIDFFYDNDKCTLKVEYFPEHNMMTFTGGRHSYARLIEELLNLAETNQEANHLHWRNHPEDSLDLIVTLSGKLKDE